MRRYTRDQKVIQSWADERGAQPARVRGTDVLRLVFGAPPPNWELLDWPTFFQQFETSRLAFLYEDSPGSRICKLVKGQMLDD